MTRLADHTRMSRIVRRPYEQSGPGWWIPSPAAHAGAEATRRLSLPDPKPPTEVKEYYPALKREIAILPLVSPIR